jgi:phosphoserine phosphatase
MRALIFDLDGTLVDTVYGHVLAWQRVDLLAARRAGMLSIGRMSGGYALEPTG